jgi:hypothetical protein
MTQARELGRFAPVIDWDSVDLASGSLDDIAERLGVNPSTVSRARAKRGVPSLTARGLQVALARAQEAAARAGQPIPQTLEDAHRLAKQRRRRRERPQKTRRQTQRRAERTAAQRRSEAGTAGRIYFIAAPDVGHVKIGWTAKQAEARLGELQPSSPCVLVLMHVIEDRSEFDEHRLHERFASDRLHNEWFRLTDEIATYIEEQRQRR